MKPGNIVKGKITAIKPFGAFVEINENTQGLIHISEVADGYVHNIEDYLSVGKTVRLYVLEHKEENKLRLSYKRVNKQRKKRLSIHLKHGFKPLKDVLPTWIENYQFNDDTHEEEYND